MHSLSRKFFSISLYSAVSRGGARGPTHLFLDQTEAQRAEKIFLGDRSPLPLSKCVDDCPPPPPLSQGPALQCIIVFHLNELLLIVTRLVMASSVLNKYCTF